MNCEYIYTLLERYWSCETSVEEERELRNFFSGVNVPEELKQYTPLFSFIGEERSLIPGTDFDKKLKESIIETGREQQYITIRVFTPMLRVAATIFLIFGLGLGLFFISKQYNEPYFAETYHDPNAAIKDATYALMKISDALQTSEEASFQILHFIDDLEIDWSSIDSLHNTLPAVTGTEGPSGETITNETSEEVSYGKATEEKLQQEDNL